MASLFILRAAVTRPVSGVQGSESNLIFAGNSNFSRRAALPACQTKVQGVYKQKLYKINRLRNILNFYLDIILVFKIQIQIMKLKKGRT